VILRLRVDNVRERVLSAFLITLLFSVLAVQNITTPTYTAQAQEIPNMYIHPVDIKNSSAVIGQNFRFNINISNVEHLFGWQANITFNKAVVNCSFALNTPTKVRSSWFDNQFGGAGYTQYVVSINYVAGYILVAGAKKPLYDGPGASGSGPLAYLTFTVIANERATLLAFGDNTYLRTAAGGVLSPIEPFTAQDGSFDNRPSLVNTAPTADFSYTPLGTGLEGERIEFDPSASSDPDAWLERYSWDYGDGTSELYIYNRTAFISEAVLHRGNWTTTVIHAYEQAGTYTITLTVTDNDGATATTTRDIVLLHDIAIKGVQAGYIAVMPGIQVPIDLNISNNGNYTETFDINVCFNETLIETKNIIDMPPHNETTLAFSWNTTGVPLGRYYLIANTSEVAGDIHTQDNTYTDGIVTIASSNLVQFSVSIGGRTFTVQVDSTSVAEDLNFNRAEKKIDFSLTGALGWFSNVTIPMTLLNVSSPDDWIVKLNGDTTAYTATSNGTHYFIYLEYVQSAEPYIVSITGETVATPPVALFTVSKTLAIAGESITFDASTSYDPDGTIESWSWVFGDGEIDTGEIVQHSFATNDTYTVTLTVKDDEDLTNSTQAIITVTIAVHDIALTDLTATPSTARIGETVTLQLTASNNGNFTESFSVTAYRNDTETDVEIETRSITNLQSKGSELLTILWNTTDTAPGLYTIKVETSTIPEETKTEDNTLTGVTVTVQKRISSLTVDASSIVVTLGDSTIISGTLTPTLQGKTITLQYQLVGQSWTTLGTATTDAQSSYQFTWTPTAAGTYEIQATWQGDTNTEAYQSDIETITVQEAQTQAIPTEYVAITIALAVILIAVVVYLLRFRKR
jgi:PKD repeat protein